MREIMILRIVIISSITGIEYNSMKENINFSVLKCFGLKKGFHILKCEGTIFQLPKGKNYGLRLSQNIYPLKNNIFHLCV